jgi:signal transduction histidine kinase
MESRGISLELDIEERLPPVRGNSLMIDQMLQNLISNALDAMPNGGTLTVAAHAANAGDQVELKVTDTGVGLPKDRLEQIFKPFVTSKRTGLGLGLSLVRQLVERLGGTIALSSQEGRGTTASLRLPEAVE